MQCPECDQTFSKRGFQNHVANCGKVNVGKAGRLTPMQVINTILVTILKLDIAYLLPRPTFESCMYYILFVYPGLYVFVWRMVL